MICFTSPLALPKETPRKSRLRLSCSHTSPTNTDALKSARRQRTSYAFSARPRRVACRSRHALGAAQQKAVGLRRDCAIVHRERGDGMRRTMWSALIVGIALLGAVPARAVDTCENASARFVGSVIDAARVWLLSQIPHTRACTVPNRLPSRLAARVTDLCAAGTVARLTCTAREAIFAVGLSYGSLSATTFAYLCNGASCGNGIVD